MFSMKMGNHAIAGHGKQRIGLARTDDDAARSEFAGTAHELHKQIEGVGTHFLRCRGDVHVDIRHVDGNQPQPRFAEPAQAAEL
jgi:hypothetical protein